MDSKVKKSPTQKSIKTVEEVVDGRVKSNQYGVALKKLSNYTVEFEIPKTVPEAEKGYIHCILINQVHVPTEKRYDVTARIVKYDERAWVKQKERIGTMGYSEAIIFHK